MPRKTFTAGEVLAAADVNNFLMDQSVMTFADSDARGSAIGTAIAQEGMLTYLEDTDAFEYWDGAAFEPLVDGGGGKILQVVGAITTTLSTVSSGTFADSGLTATITPTSDTSKILVLIGQSVAAVSSLNDRALAAVQTVRGATVVASSGGYNIAALVDSASNGFFQINTFYTLSLLDSPASTSALTYKTQMKTVAATNISAQPENAASTITLLEVAV